MKRYEGLFILETAGKEEGIKDAVDKITGHVLGRFSSTEAALADRVITVASDQAETWVEAGIQKAMNQFNGIVDDAGNESEDK